MPSVGQYHLARLADSAIERVGEHESLLFEGTTHTNVELFRRAERVAGGLRALGVQPGDRVVILMMNAPEVGITYNAVWRAGAVVTPVMFLISAPELRHILTDSEAVAVVVTPELLPLLRAASEGLKLHVVLVGGPAVETVGGPAVDTLAYASLEAADPLPITPRQDDDLAGLLYTGGTTGRSKGVMLSHHGLWLGGYAMNDVGSELGSARSLLPLPLSHIYGLAVTIGGMHADEPRFAVLQRWFDAAEWVRLVEEHRLETSAVVPAMLTMLLAQPLEEHDLSSFRTFGCGSAPLAAALREKVQDRMGVAIYEGYGCTEASAGVTACRPSANRPGSVGKPLKLTEVAILSDEGKELAAGEDGEICVRSPSVMTGYWKSPEQSAEALAGGWLHTGDIGHVDADGYVYVVDRKKDLIIRGGFNVFPRDVEDVLLTHRDVVSAAVVGRPDETHGEEVVALVALQPGSSVSSEELIAYSQTRLARYKYPREIRIVDAVPVTSVGKTDRKTVRQILNS